MLKQTHTLRHIEGLPDESVHEERWALAPGRPFTLRCPVCAAPAYRPCVKPPVRPFRRKT